MIACNKTIGVLHLGELGAAVAKALRGRDERQDHVRLARHVSDRR